MNKNQWCHTSKNENSTCLLPQQMRMIGNEYLSLPYVMCRAKDEFRLDMNVLNLNVTIYQI
jgi:hypothetical protein